MNESLPRGVLIAAGSLLLLMLLLALLPEPPPVPAPPPAPSPSPSVPAAASVTPEARTPIPELQDAGALLLDCAPALCLVNADGTGMRRVEPLVAGMMYAMPAWAPDGRSFVAVMVEDPSQALARPTSTSASPPAPPGDELVLFSADGRPLRRQSPGSRYLLAWSNPRWAPDGRSIALLTMVADHSRSATSEPREIWILPAGPSGGAGPRPQIIPGGVLGEPLQWSSDSRWLGYVYLPLARDNPEARPEIRAYDTWTGDVRSMALGYALTWQPGTETLVYVPDNAHELRSVDVVSGADRVLVSEAQIAALLTPAEREAGSLWSMLAPDWARGQHGGLAFAVRYLAPLDAELVFTLSAPGGALRRWPDTTSGGWASHAWSPDGRFLVYPYWSELRQHPDVERRDRFAIGCPSGLLVADLVSLTAAAEACLFLPTPGDAWSPDSRWLVALARVSRDGLTVFAPDNPHAYWGLAGMPIGNGAHWQP